MYQDSKKVVAIKEYCCFDHSDFLAHLLFAFDVCWGSLDTSIFRNSSSAASNTRSRLPSRLSVSYDYELKIDLNRLNVCFLRCFQDQYSHPAYGQLTCNAILFFTKYNDKIYQWLLPLHESICILLMQFPSPPECMYAMDGQLWLKWKKSSLRAGHTSSRNARLEWKRLL